MNDGEKRACFQEGSFVKYPSWVGIFTLGLTGLWIWVFFKLTAWIL